LQIAFFEPDQALMSLPTILRYVYNHGTEEVIRRGKKIFYGSGVQMLDVDHLLEQVRFRVRNDLYQNYYTVTVNKYLQPKEMTVRCQCPYNLGEICRHEVGALFQLNDILQSGFFENVTITYDQKHTVVRMRQINRQMLQLFTSADVIENAERMGNAGRATIITNKNGNVEADVPDDNAVYRVTIRQNEDKYFDTSCSCSESSHPLCEHKAILFFQILKIFGAQHFQSMQNWDVQKNKLLEQYGYSLKDNLTNKFEFIYENNKPFLRVLDPSIKKIESKKPIVPIAPPPETVAAPPPEEKRLGIVIDISNPTFPFVDVQLIGGFSDEEEQKMVGNIEKLELSQYVNPMGFRADDRDLLPVIRKFLPDELLKYLKKTLPFGDFLNDYESVLKDVPEDEVREQAWEYLLPKYQKLLDRYSLHPFIYLKNQGKLLSSKTIEPVAFSGRQAHPQLVASKTGKTYTVQLEWNIEAKAVPNSEVSVFNSALLMHEGTIYAMGTIQDIQLAEKLLPDGVVVLPAKDWQHFLREKLMPWSENTHVHFSEELVEHVDDAKPECRLYMHERDQTLVLQPAFVYAGFEIKPGYFGDVIQPKDGIVTIMKRNETAEREFLELIQTLHTDIQHNKKEGFFHLPGTAVLTNNWFFRFTELMKERGVDLMGFEGLKNLRVNVHKPQTQIQVSSGIDWFDASVELTFGDQSVSIIEVKKALAQRQNFVRLGDGSIGLLPDEWLKKYSLLLKMGETKGNKVRLKKFHFSVLDELLADIDEDTLQQELEIKKEKLESILSTDYSNIVPPDHLTATLRPYQVAGFQWLIFLNEAGWGGILADDMGLGKTVQTLAFFQHYKNLHPDAIFMVVCPTTLMYNWENEIKKFTPEMTHVIHHGPKRNPMPASYKGFDIIITTYGTMRSDIKGMREIEFDYVVLDESQSIKNPQSQVAKASLLLNCKNRLALSGTPVQNNTFDLYAQMNFLNPGMLGSREFFMSEFATPIDKFMEDEVKQQLRKLTHPFLLRRTKEQVAKDLPEKTETILYCEMGTEQRKIYDAYRNTYRSQILGMIEERGMERSQMHILQGLTRLRQICDSPAILNEEERFHNYSVKLDELSREITENVGDHKVLIFSQFLGMLALIKAKLNEEKISHVYFDGSSTSVERERAIQEFQNNPECRVFLISLKAGGIGLNLTAADYVYIVDPWWNPAVEQQAIDRTHRIGQTKNIFAYRLICKDTLEEKMLQLQERKRALASELVSDDNAFMKRLTKDDIAFLFS
jgi:superfamily II DNA or RNA helicase